MDLGAHAFAKRRVDELMARNATFALERCADDKRFEVLAVALHFEHAAIKSLRNVALDIFRRRRHLQWRIL